MHQRPSKGTFNVAVVVSDKGLAVVLVTVIRVGEAECALTRALIEAHSSNVGICRVATIVVLVLYIVPVPAVMACATISSSP